MFVSCGSVIVLAALQLTTTGVWKAGGYAPNALFIVAS